MALYYRKLAILAKIETTAGTDAAPTGAANSMLVSNVVIKPLGQELDERNVSTPWGGAQESVIAARWCSVEFETEVAGAGAAGTAPKWGPLMRASSFAEVVTAGVDVLYSRVTAGTDRVTIYAYLDGVLHKLLYGAGDVSFGFTARKIPRAKWTFTGLFMPMTDTALPTTNYTGWVKPLAVNKANTPGAKIFAVDVIAEQMTFNAGNQVSYRNVVGFEGTVIQDHKGGGRAVVEMPTVAALPVLNNIDLGTADTMLITHGTVPGNIIQVRAPLAQLTNPDYTQSDGVTMLQAAATFLPNTTGVDFTVKVY